MRFLLQFFFLIVVIDSHICVFNFVFAAYKLELYFCSRQSPLHSRRKRFLFASVDARAFALATSSLHTVESKKAQPRLHNFFLFSLFLVVLVNNHILYQKIFFSSHCYRLRRKIATPPIVCKLFVYRKYSLDCLLSPIASAAVRSIGPALPSLLTPRKRLVDSCREYAHDKIFVDRNFAC